MKSSAVRLNNIYFSCQSEPVEDLNALLSLRQTQTNSFNNKYAYRAGIASLSLARTIHGSKTKKGATQIAAPFYLYNDSPTGNDEPLLV